MALYDKRFYFILCILFLIVSCQNKDGNQGNEDTLQDPILEDYEAPIRKIGFIDTNGIQIIKSRFDEVRGFASSRAAVNKNGLWGFIEPSGKWVIRPKYLGAWSFQEGLARIQSTGDRLFGFIDLKGQVYIPPTYKDASDFHFGYSRVKQGNYYGLINFDNVFVLQPKYEGIRILGANHVAVKKDKSWYIIKVNKPEIEIGPYQTVYEQHYDLYRVKRPDGAIDIVDAFGENIFDFKTTNAIFTGKSNVFALELSADQWKLFTIDGQPINDQFYDKIRYIQSGRLAVRGDDGWKLMDHKGNMISNNNFAQIYHFSDGYAVFMRDQLWGYVDTSGQIAAPARYGLAWPFSEGKARVLTRQGVGVVDSDFNLIIKPGLGEVRDFKDGLAAIKTYTN